MNEYLQILQDYVNRRDNNIQAKLDKCREMFRAEIPDIQKVIELSEFMAKHDIPLTSSPYFYVNSMLRPEPVLIMKSDKNSNNKGILFCVNEKGQYWFCFSTKPQWYIPIRPEQEKEFLLTFIYEFHEYKQNFFNYIKTLKYEEE